MKKVAVIGAGQWGQNLVRTFAELGVLEAVAEPNPQVRERLRAQHAGVAFYEQYSPILTSDIEAVAIATPVETHYRIAREALLAGKDVFVEKPVTLSADAARDLQELAEERGRVLMVGHLLLYQPAVQWMKRFLQDGELGAVRSLHQRRAKLGRVRTVENALWSLGVHDIAVLLHLVGEEPTRIMCQGQRVLQEEVEDDVHLHLEFANNVQAHLHTSWLWPQNERRLTVVGERGMLVYDEVDGTVTLHRKRIDGDLRAVDEGAEVLFKGSGEPLKKECMHFLECVEFGLPPLSDGANGMAVVRVLEAAKEKMEA